MSFKQDFMNFTYAKDEANLDKSSRFFTSVTIFTILSRNSFLNSFKSARNALIY